MLQSAPDRGKNDLMGLQQPRIDDSAVLFPGELAQLMGLRLRSGEYVPHRHTSHQKGIGEQPAVALPPHSLRAQNCRWRDRREFFEHLDRVLEFPRLHVIRVTPEPLVAPRGIHRILARLAEAPEPRKMAVGDAVLRQERVQPVLPELRVPTRGGDGADVGELADAVRLEQPEERGGCVHRVTDCVDHG